MKNINRIIYCLLFSMLFSPAAIAKGQTFLLESPDGKLKIVISLNEKVQWTIRHENDVVLNSSAMSLVLGNGTVLGKNPQLLDSERKSVDTVIPSPLFRPPRARRCR